MSENEGGLQQKQRKRGRECLDFGGGSRKPATRKLGHSTGGREEQRPKGARTETGPAKHRERRQLNRRKKITKPLKSEVGLGRRKGNRGAAESPQHQ